MRTTVSGPDGERIIEDVRCEFAVRWALSTFRDPVVPTVSIALSQRKSMPYPHVRLGDFLGWVDEFGRPKMEQKQRTALDVVTI